MPAIGKHVQLNFTPSEMDRIGERGPQVYNPRSPISYRTTQLVTTSAESRDDGEHQLLEEERYRLCYLRLLIIDYPDTVGL